MDAQKRFVDEFLKMFGMTAVKAYYEKESGKRVRRPELKKAIRYTKRIGGTLIFSTMSRLSRYALLVADLMLKKVRFKAADKPYATELENLKEAIRVQEEVEDISRRTKDGLREARAKGVELGKYGKIQAAKNIELANAFASLRGPIIRQLHDEGLSYQDIADKWNKEKVSSFHDRHWHASTVYDTWKRSTTIKP